MLFLGLMALPAAVGAGALTSAVGEAVRWYVRTAENEKAEQNAIQVLLGMEKDLRHRWTVPQGPTMEVEIDNLHLHEIGVNRLRVTEVEWALLDLYRREARWEDFQVLLGSVLFRPLAD